MNLPEPSDASTSVPEAQTSHRPWQPGAFTLHLWLAMLVLATFLPALRHDFINYDDELYVTHNSVVQDGLTWAGLKWAFSSTVTGNWHPLTWLSHMLDCDLFGPRAWGHHLTSILIHATATLLLFHVLKRMTGATWRSFFVTALFGLHPLRVESVAWIAERKDVLCAFFWMATTLAWLNYTDAARQRKRSSAFRYAFALLLFVAGFMCKPMIVTLPFMLILMDWWPVRRIESCQTQDLSPTLSRNRSFLEKLPFLFLAGCFSLLTWRIQHNEGYVMTAAAYPFIARLENALVAYWRYLGKLVWPADLSVFYPLRDHWPIGLVLPAGLLLLVVTVLVLVLRARRPHLLFGWFWFLVTLLPVIGLVQAGDQSMADRYSYLPSIGVFLAVVWAAHALTQSARQRIVLFAAATAIVLLCGIQTRRQLGYWQDSLTLFTRAHRLTGDSYVVNKCLGAALVADGRPAEAIAPLEKNVASEPADAQARLDLGIALARAGRRDDAIRKLKEAVKLNPNLANAHANLGSALCEQGALEEGIGQLKLALELTPDDVGTLRNLGIALISAGRRDEAVRVFRRALELRPDFTEAEEALKSLTNSPAR